MNTALVEVRPEGLYCPAGDFYIDPWRPVARAVITHAHADHARPGSAAYWATAVSEGILRQRLGQDIGLTGLAYGERLRLGEVWLSLHPAGHVLGSAQVRMETPDGTVWVVTGDYKRDPDPTAEPFEVVPCDTLITEATFGLPVYRWPATSEVAREIVAWWDANRAEGVTSLLFCYAFGKAQRLIAEIGRHTDRPVVQHGAVATVTDTYRAQGYPLVNALRQSEVMDKAFYETALVLAPPSAFRSPWMKKFKAVSTGFASGWMAVRGNRRRRGYDRGFVVSDHADWPGLLQTVRESGARTVYVTHGQKDVLARYLQEHLQVCALSLDTLYTGDQAEEWESVASD